MISRKRLRAVPDEPGVYLFKGPHGEVLYVGKARRLRARLRSYFATSPPSDRIGRMLSEARDLDWILTDGEAEAFGLENNLIKEHRPPYNILFRDDKTYPYLKVTTGEDFPEAFVTRRVEHDGHAYFGPYVPPANIRQLLRFVQTQFRVRQCSGDLAGKRAFSCIYYQLHQCDGPCSGLIGKRAYRRLVEDAVTFLKGRRRELTAALKERMRAHSEKQEYEKAAQARDLLRTLDTAAPGGQKMSTAGHREADVFGFARERRRAALHVFVIRGGAAVHHRRFLWSGLDAGIGEDELAEAALAQFYGEPGAEVPREILLPVLPPEHEAARQWLEKRRGKRLRLAVPERGAGRGLVALAARNARLCLQEPSLATPAADFAPPWAALGLDVPPRRIDGFDVSHLHGGEAVASLVVWKDGRPASGEYRRYAIREAAPGDDYAAMREVVRRRFRRALEEGTEMPDLVMVDGGAGQVSAAREALLEFHLDRLPVAGLAKREEEIFLPGRRAPLRLDARSAVLRTLQRLRDEAHRFAVEYHRKKRSRRFFRSALTEIAGVGEGRARRLLRTFGSLEAVAAAEEVVLAPILGKALARRVKAALGSVTPPPGERREAGRTQGD
jgi:excinuclease ABC subunit C